MPLAPRWLVETTRIVFLAVVPYILLQIIILLFQWGRQQPLGLQVMIARLAVPGIAPLFLYNIPILFSVIQEIQQSRDKQA
jgi:hypothetical protein